MTEREKLIELLGVDLSLDGESITAVKIALAIKAGANAIKAD